jgi:S-DNA-T family DNA segregation ATPase FtsK/SpoIIIE
MKNQPRQTQPKGQRSIPLKEKIDRLPIFDLKDGRLVKVLGLFFLILSVFFLTAFTSYVFTWQEDQSYVSKANGGWGNLFKNEQELALHDIRPVVDNWMGKFGALLSNQFIYEWFWRGIVPVCVHLFCDGLPYAV